MGVEGNTCHWLWTPISSLRTSMATRVKPDVLHWLFVFFEELLIICLFVTGSCSFQMKKSYSNVVITRFNSHVMKRIQGSADKNGQETERIEIPQACFACGWTWHADIIAASSLRFHHATVWGTNWKDITDLVLARGDHLFDFTNIY